MERLRTPPEREGRLPNTDEASTLPRDVRADAKKIAKYYYDELQSAMIARRPHAMSWIKVLSIMSGFHYFKVTEAGGWVPLRKRNESDIRAFIPLLDPYYRREHGRLSTNQIGCSATPTTGRGPSSFWDAQLAQDLLTHWIDETQLQGVDDEANQHLLVYGGYAMYAEKSMVRRQVYARSFPFCELFPVPHDARTWAEMDGVQRSIMVSEQWLEAQDELYQKRHGSPPERPMSRLSKTVGTKPNISYAGFSSGVAWGAPFKGARATWIWRRPNEMNPFGEHLFMVEDELFGYVSGQSASGELLGLLNGDIPLHPVYYLKKPHDWWPYGFCEGLVPIQREVNRQVTDILVSSRVNRGFIAYNTESIDQKTIANAVDGLVPFKPGGYENSRTQPLYAVSGQTSNRDVGAVLTIFQESARQVAAHESGIIAGQQEGRTEGGPATGILNANAQAPIQPVFDRKERAYDRLFRDVLHHIRAVWPEEKVIRTIGPQNLAKERLIRREDIPRADQVALSTTPLIANGRMGMLNLLFAMRSQPPDPNEPPLVRSYELRRSMAMMRLAPPGLDLYDVRERRIMWRIGMLINDGMMPAIAPAGMGNDYQHMEDHVLAVEKLREIILEPGFSSYGPAVQKALNQELEYHGSRVPGSTSMHSQVDAFDDDLERFDAAQAEQALEAMENDPISSAGLMAPDGLLLGV